MADCGASGSTLDRAARAIGGQDGGKHVASWLGHMAVRSAGGGAGLLPPAPMPVVSPDHIVMPSIGSSVGSRSSAAPVSASQALHSRSASSMKPAATPQVQHPSVAAAPLHPVYAAPNPAIMPLPQQAQLQHHPMMMMPPPPAQQQQMIMAQHHQAMMMAQHHHHHQQQQQHMMMMAAQQQQQMMMAQQQHQHMMMVQQQQQQQLGRMQQQKVAAANMASHQQQELKRVEDDVVTIGDEEENVRHDEEEEGYRGHEGESRPVRIEELAAAWAEAQAEYEELEAAVNLAAAHGYGEDDPDADAAIAYEFVNQVSTELERKTDSHEDPNYMEEGMSHFASGNLTEAIRAFEMELQVRGSDNAAAWTMLGRCHAENDQDQAAIACLQQAAERDPTSPEARLALGVSQVNELQHAAALRNLKAWITSNPKYAGIVKDSPESFLGPAGDEGEGLEEAFNEVQRLLLQALSVEADPDVLEALGVVYNVSRDYEAAVDAFTRAIALQPDSYQLYNRLGATLANCSQSDKALPMYKRALELRPKYARAWLNSAISFSNLQSYDDAARCYLQTLSLNPSAMHCWSYLRIALSCSEKWDLIPFAAAMDLQAFKDHYDFVLYK